MNLFALLLRLCGLLLIAFVALGCDGTADSSTATQAPAAAPPSVVAGNLTGPPRLTFDSEVIDLGSFSEVQSKNARFHFTNTGGETLIIGQIKTTCTCTAPTLAKKNYQPGDRGYIDILYTPTGPNAEPKIINVFSNAPAPNPDQPFIRLKILAEAKTFLDFQPRLIEVGVLAYRHPHTITVTVSCPPDPTFKIDSIKTTNPHITATLNPASANSALRSIAITIQPTAAWGNLFSWLEVTATGKPAADAAPVTHVSKLRIQGQVFGQLRAEPDTVRFGAKPGESFERIVKVSRTDGQPFELFSASVIKSDLPGATVRVLRRSPSMYEIIFNATGDRLRPLAEGTIAITTNVPGEEQLVIPISGVVRIDNPGVR